MRMIVSLCLLMFLQVQAPARAYAAAPTEASVERLLEVTNSKALLETSYAGLEQNIRQFSLQSMGDKQPTDAQMRALDELIARMAELLRREVSWERLHPQFRALYVETFDQTEVDGLIAFYESAPGKAAVAKMPTVQQKSMAIVQTMLASLMPQLNELIARSVTDIQHAEQPSQ